jgi:hypothetical protein
MILLKLPLDNMGADAARRLVDPEEARSRGEPAVRIGQETREDLQGVREPDGKDRGMP